MSALPRSSRNLVILTTSIFIVLIVITMKLETGVFALGYPWTFYSYSYTEAMLSTSSRSIQPAFFIIEWLMVAALMILTMEGIKKIRR
jgi:hypothetical protein